MRRSAWPCPATAPPWPPRLLARSSSPEAGRRIVDLCQALLRAASDESVLPRSIATKEAFENAMSLDVAMGGSTNTVLHILAIAHEAGVDFTLDDIDAISRRVPCLCKVAPNSTTYHIEHVHRAGGIPALLGELNRAGLLNTNVHSVHSDNLDELAGRVGRAQRKPPPTRPRTSSSQPPVACAPPRRSPPRTATSPSTLDSENGCIRAVGARLHQGRRPGGPATATSPQTARSSSLPVSTRTCSTSTATPSWSNRQDEAVVRHPDQDT